MLRLIGQTVNKPKEEEAEKEQPERLSSHFLITESIKQLCKLLVILQTYKELPQLLAPISTQILSWRHCFL